MLTVKLRLAAVFDAQHGGFATGWSSISWGSIDELVVNLTMPGSVVRRIDRVDPLINHGLLGCPAGVRDRRACWMNLLRFVTIRSHRPTNAMGVETAASRRQRCRRLRDFHSDARRVRSWKR